MKEKPVSEQLKKLGYKISKNRFGYFNVYLNGYRQHQNKYCTPDMAQEILNKHR